MSPGASDLLPLAILLGVLLLSGGLTYGFTAIAGRRIATRSHRLATLIASSLVPGVALAVAVVLHAKESMEHPGSDGPAMALTGSVMLCAVALLASIPAARIGLEKSSSSGDGTERTSTHRAAHPSPEAPTTSKVRKRLEDGMHPEDG